MGVIHIGVQQSHRHAFKTRYLNLINQGLNVRAVQGFEHLAVCLHAFIDGIAEIAGQQRLGEDQIEIILLKPTFGAHLDHIAKSFRGDKGGFCAAPFNQSISGQSGAVDDLADPCWSNVGLLTYAVHPIDDSIIRGGVGGQDLGGKQFFAML